MAVTCTLTTQMKSFNIDGVQHTLFNIKRIVSQVTHPSLQAAGCFAPDNRSIGNLWFIDQVERYNELFSHYEEGTACIPYSQAADGILMQKLRSGTKIFWIQSYYELTDCIRELTCHVLPSLISQSKCG
ncbi:hypothetical protein O9929_15480 [Vibrio lentus]|nr:hypothetical protein [Vibrio lentus]